MAKVGAQRAAELTGVSKSTIQRSMKAGKLSFEMDSNQRRLIDVSELERVFGLQPQGAAPVSSHAAAPAAQYVPDTSAALELEKARHELECEKLRMEIRLVQEQLDNAQSQIEDLKVQRDLWQKQAQQILITSQYSQKQSEERIAEFREREETRQRIIEQRKTGGVVQHTGARTAQNPVKTPDAQGAQGNTQKPVAGKTATTVPPSRVTPAQTTQAPVFRTVQSSNQNRTEEKQSLFASLFGAKKKKQG